MGVFIAIVLMIALIAIKVLRKLRSDAIESTIKLENSKLAKKGEEPLSEEQVDAYTVKNAFPVPAFVDKIVTVCFVIALVAGTFSKIFFYAQPGYIYHVKTIFGGESVYSSLGWKPYWFGEYTEWKQAVTIQARNAADADDNNVTSSSNLAPVSIIFLDQVDAKASAMVRFRLPTGKDEFLKMVHNYRTPANLINSVMLTSFQETLNATASLMTAEEYYSGGRTQFTNEFRDQIEKGIFIVRREEQIEGTPTQAESSANASLDIQDQFGDGNKVVYVVTKLVDPVTNLPKRKTQDFLEYGIVVDDARITNMKPNNKFQERMTLKQKASADRAIAREQRIQEEEQRLLAITKGEREVAERQAKAKVEQIEKTTHAETEKQLVLTKASQQKEQAEIDKQTAAIRLEQAQIDARRIKTVADAEAHARKVKLKADNALKMKLDALVDIAKIQGDAFAKRQVPQQVIYSGSAADGGLGSNAEVDALLNTQLLKNIKALDVDVSIANK